MLSPGSEGCSENTAAHSKSIKLNLHVVSRRVAISVWQALHLPWWVNTHISPPALIGQWSQGCPELFTSKFVTILNMHFGEGSNNHMDLHKSRLKCNALMITRLKWIAVSQIMGNSHYHSISRWQKLCSHHKGVTSEPQVIKNVFSIFSSTLPSKTFIEVGKDRLIVINDTMIK